MPTTKKRVNLTVPDELYEQLQDFKKRWFITSDATACLQLIAKQLQSQEASDKIMKVMKSLSIDELQALINQGMKEMKSLPEIPK